MTIIPQEQLAHGDYRGPQWHERVYENLYDRLGRNSDFPCLFSQNAFRRELIRFAFVEDASDGSIDRLAADLASYVELSRDWDGSLATAYPLIVAFSHEAIADKSLEEYHAFGWRILQALHRRDRSDWPDDVAKDPHSPFWSMCFAGMQLFVNMSHPAHWERLSRNLGDHLVFVINPRERFDVVAGDTPAGRKVRQNIRERIAVYDGKTHARQLGSYVAGDIEWWQYGLIEENRPRVDKCPFVVEN